MARRKPKRRRRVARTMVHAVQRSTGQKSHLTTPRRKVNAPRRKPKRVRQRTRSDLLVEIAVRDMNRGRSLTATARSLHLSPKSLQRLLKRQGLARRKGKRWVTKDNRLRRVPVMTGGRFRVLTVRGYEPARLVGAHHNAVGEFVRTNNIKLIAPFRGKGVQAANGRHYVLETDPNALHRIAAMDSPPFHEIYEITSNT